MPVPFVVLLDNPPRKERPVFEKRVRMELAHGNTVVIDNITSEIDSIFSEEDILRERKFDPHKIYDIHSKFNTLAYAVLH